MLPGFAQKEYRRPHGYSTERNHDGDHEQQQHPQLQLLTHPEVSDVPGCAGPPFVLPELIHQVVEDKCNLPCEVHESMQSWTDMNPGYTHVLYDMADMLDFVQTHYHELLTFYNDLPSNKDRIDIWRYLVLHQLGGVYADSDVRCMQPISTWNEEHSFDGALLVGMAEHTTNAGSTTMFNQFVLAAMPGHPVLALITLDIAAKQAKHQLTRLPWNGRKNGVDVTTATPLGPRGLASALEAYAHQKGAEWPTNSTEGNLQSRLVGSVRAMPKDALDLGWDAQHLNMTCLQVKETFCPGALICRPASKGMRILPEEQAQTCVFIYSDCNRKPEPAGANILIDADYDYDYSIG